MPINATKIVVTGQNGYLYKVQAADGLLPSPVSNVTSESTDSSITLHFVIPANATKAVVYEGTILVGATTDGTITHTPVFADSEHTYTIYAINNAGCSMPVQYTARSLRPDVVFYGPSPAIFDCDPNTGIRCSTNITVTWDGNLFNREISVTLVGYVGYYSGYVRVTIHDIGNNLLNFINADNNQMVNNITCSTYNSKATYHLIVPPGAAKIVFTAVNGEGMVYDVGIVDNGQLPNPVSNITSESTDSSVTLHFTMPTNATKAVVYEGTTLVGVTTNGTITHTPVFADSEHTYTIYAVNNAGCSVPVQYTARSLRPDVVFYGPSPAIFDHNPNTGTNIGTGITITWQGDLANRQISVTLAGSICYYSGSAYVKIYDAKNNLLNFINAANNQIVSSIVCSTYHSKATYRLIVPSDAAKIMVTGECGALYDVSVEK